MQIKQKSEKWEDDEQLHSSNQTSYKSLNNDFILFIYNIEFYNALKSSWYSKPNHVFFTLE